MLNYSGYKCGDFSSAHELAALLLGLGFTGAVRVTVNTRAEWNFDRIDTIPEYVS
jgi:hypothetical protein